jgi:hypothetical protein
MTKKTSIILLLCLSSFNVVADDVTEQFSACAVTDNDKERLACYDKLRDDIVAANQPKQAKLKGYTPIDLADLKVDIKSMVGKKVEVSALIQTMGDTSFLKSDALDMSPVFSLTDKLPRDDRKKLLNGCQAILCGGTFYGTIINSSFGASVSIEKVNWR